MMKKTIAFDLPMQVNIWFHILKTMVRKFSLRKLPNCLVVTKLEIARR